jgi:hypothetical protein
MVEDSWLLQWLCAQAVMLFFFFLAGGFQALHRPVGFLVGL